MKHPEIKEKETTIEVVYSITKKAALTYHNVCKCVEANSGYVKIDDAGTYDEVIGMVLDENKVVCDTYWVEFERLKERLEYLSNANILMEEIEEDGIETEAGAIMDIVCPMLILCDNKPTVFYYVDKDLDLVIDELEEFLSEDYREYFKALCKLEECMCGKLFNGYVILLIFMSLKPKEMITEEGRLSKTYLMKDGTGLYKIGRSYDPYQRLKDIRCGNSTVELICEINEDIEKELHQEYSEKRIRGEWFRLSSSDVEEIVRLSKKHRK